MDQMILMAMQTCQEFAEKSAATPLTEYEMLMYEQMCQYVTTYCRGVNLSLRCNIPELERNALQAEAEHREWMRAQDEPDADDL